MLPLKDYNATRTTAWLTLLLIGVNVAVYFLVQPVGKATFVSNEQSRFEDARYTLAQAAIPKEVVRGRPLTEAEVVEQYHSLGAARLCSGVDTPGDVVPDRACFPGKNVYLAVLYSMFLHGSLLHIGGNMLFLWIFGNNIEDTWGRIRYLLFYLASGVVATGAHILVNPSSAVPLVGASGAIAGVMGAYLVLFPNVYIRTVFIVLLIFVRDIRAKWLLGFWLLSQFFLNQEGVAWTAHVGGFLFGMLVGLIARGLSGEPRAQPQPVRW